MGEVSLRDMLCWARGMGLGCSGELSAVAALARPLPAARPPIFRHSVPNTFSYRVYCGLSSNIFLKMQPYIIRGYSN